jgi:hypothetical protein
MRPEPPLAFHPSSLADLPLDLVVDRIDGGLGDDDGHLITLRDVGRALELGFRPLDGEHPVDVLLGWHAPADVDALGVAVCGTARTLDGNDDPRAGRVRIVQLHARDGRAASRMRRVGSDPPQVLETGVAEGDVADCLRRALGLPTPAAPCSPLTWWAIEWLDAVLDAVCGDPGRAWTWDHVSALHRCSGPLPPDRPAALVEQVAEAGAALDWPAVRRRAAAGEEPHCPIGPQVAGWMDDGMFARWLVGSLPEPVDVVIDLVDLLPAPVTRGVVEALQAWGCW